MCRDTGKCPFIIDPNVLVRRRKRSLSKNTFGRNSLFTPIERSEKIKKRAFPCILARAALTVEAAAAVPLFFMTVICIASIMGIYSGTLEKMVSLRDTCEQTAVYASALEDEMWIDITLPQQFKPLFLPSGVSVGSVMCRGYARAWTGRSADEAEKTGEELGNNEYVYLTDNGSVYHTSAKCTHIELSIQSVSGKEINTMRSSDGSKYKACERCSDSEKPSDTVYITEDGDRYHNSSSCSGLKRTVRMADISEAEGLRECSRCASQTQ